MKLDEGYESSKLFYIRFALLIQALGSDWCGVVWCGVVWCGVVWCGVVWCGVVWCGVVWCDFKARQQFCDAISTPFLSHCKSHGLTMTLK